VCSSPPSVILLILIVFVSRKPSTLIPVINATYSKLVSYNKSKLIGEPFPSSLLVYNHTGTTFSRET
jgi:hypothetical protein